MKKVILIGTLFLALLAIPFCVSQYNLHIINMTTINIGLALSLWILVRQGLISLAHAGFMGIGGYTTAILTRVVDSPVNVWVTLLLGGLIAALIAFLIGMVVLHLRMAYFFLVSLAIAEFFRSIWLHMDYPFRSAYGITNIPRPEGFPFCGGMYQSFYYLILAFTLVSLVVFYRITNSRYGLLTKAIGANPLLCSSIGTNNRFYRVQIFIISSFFAGVGGAILATYSTFVSPFTYTIFISLNLMIYTLVGGVGIIWGPMIGAGLLTIVSELLLRTAQYRTILFGALLVLVVVFLPEGMVSLQIQSFWGQRKKSQKV